MAPAGAGGAARPAVTVRGGRARRGLRLPASGLIALHSADERGPAGRGGAGAGVGAALVAGGDP